jgi:hypothetical protein
VSADGRAPRAARFDFGELVVRLRVERLLDVLRDLGLDFRAGILILL